MKKLLSVGLAAVAFSLPAMAADLPMKAAAIPVVAPFNWNGFYVGGHMGVGWESSDVTNVGTVNSVNFPFGTTSRLTANGFLGGAQAGYNWQFNPSWLLGVEGDISGASITGHQSNPSLVNAAIVSNPSVRFDELATIAGRVGYIAGDWLLYGKGGWGWAHFHDNGITTNGGVPILFQSGSGTRSGWAAGAGAEYSFLSNWSVKVEYNYIGLGKDTLASTVSLGNAQVPTGSVLLRDHDSHIQLAKIGFNYHFNGGGSVVAKY